MVVVLMRKSQPQKVTKPKKPKAGGSARITVMVAAVSPASGAPPGKVVVKDARTKLGKFKLKKGKAKIRLRDLKAGKHKLKVKYKGGQIWDGTSAATTVSVKTP